MSVVLTAPALDEREALRRRALALLGDAVTDVGTADAHELVDRLCARLEQVERLASAGQELDEAERYRALVEHAYGTINLVAADGTFLYLGPHSDHLLGYPPEQMVGQSGFDLVHSDDLAEVKQRFADVLRRPGQPVTHAARMRHRDGSWRWIEMTANNLLDNPGLKAILVNARDISDRVCAEAALRESEQRYRLLFDTNPHPMWVYDAETLKFLAVNEAAVATYGWSREAFLQMSIVDIRPPEEVPRLLESLPGWVPALRRCGQWRHRKANGALIDVEVTTYTILFTGRPARLVLATDVTERLRAEHALRASETRFHAFMDNSPFVAFIKDEAGRYVYGNKPWARQFAAEPYQILGRTDAELWPEAAVRVFRESDDLARRLGHAIERDESATDAAGAVRHWTNFKFPLHDTTGQNLVGGVVLDITDRKRLEAEREELLNRFRTTLDRLPIGCILCGPDFHFVYWNGAAERIFGYTFAEVQGQHPFAVITPVSEHAGVTELMTRLTRGDMAAGGTWNNKTKDGRTIRCAWHNTPLFGPDGAFQGNIAMCEDVTAREQAEDERRKLEAQVQHAQKLESLGVLAGGIAHDFNNLLTGILGYADLALLEMSPVAPARSSIEQIEKTALRAADLTKQMLAYSGRGKFVVQAMNLSEVVKEMAHLLEVSISKKCALQYEFAADLPTFEADAAQIQQVVMNLIINASEAVGDQSGVIAVRTGQLACDRAYLADSYMDESLPEGPYVFLEVSDSGCGMSPETRARIFDPFFTTKFTGRGLGLAAVLGIVRGHRGAVKVTSAPGRGSTFRVLFPATNRPIEAPARAIGVGAWRGHGTVLVIEDEETVRGLARLMLKTLGFTVLTAADGRLGVEAFKANADSIRIVLLDMTMPHLDGVETYRELRRLREDVCVILTSGFTEQDATQRFEGKGLAGFLQKPFVLEDVAKAFHKALGD